MEGRSEEHLLLEGEIEGSWRKTSNAHPWVVLGSLGSCKWCRLLRAFSHLHRGRPFNLSGDSHHFLMYLYVLWSKEMDVQFNCGCPRSGGIALLLEGEDEVS